MRTWHYQRIRFYTVEPFYAADGSIVRLFVAGKNSDPKSPFRETHYALPTLGL